MSRVEREARQQYVKRRRDYLELEQNVQSSDELLSSLASYLSNFQNDLSAVSGHVADLQQRSDIIEAQLGGRKTILPPLNAFLNDITIPPALVLTIRDTTPAQNPELWLTAVSQLDKYQIDPDKASSREIESVIDGLRAKAILQLPPFLLSLIRPLRSPSKGLSTNLAVLQTALLLKYQPFYAFLLRNSPSTAKQVERGYVNAARSYYETAFRRYTRALALIKRSDGDLSYAEVDGDAVLLYMADDKDYRLPIEGLFRAISLVLLDNASAEFTFIVRFFTQTADKEAERLWHEVLDPAIESCDLFIQSLQPTSAIPLLTLIRLNDQIIDIAETRHTVPLGGFLQKQKLALWPLYRKDMDRRIEEVKRLIIEAEGRGLAGFMGKGVKDAVVRDVATRYGALFSSTVALSSEADAMMVFSSMTRMRNELVKLVDTQAAKIKTDRASYVSTVYEGVMHELVSGPGPTTHPKLQAELSFFRTRLESIV